MARQQFGGNWTETKLKIVEEYLKQYLTIFHGNPYARFFETYYVDAFAGTGYVEKRVKNNNENLKLDLNLSAEELIKGSVRRVLDVQPGFKNYIFIEQSAGKCEKLSEIFVDYPELSESIKVEKSDSISYLTEWLESKDWKRSRALIFLDPFGMQVDWELLVKIRDTQAIDLWILFPLGLGVLRTLPKNRRPPKIWADNLTRVLGTEEWQEFYTSHPQQSLMPELGAEYLDADFARLSQFLVERLKIFPGVAKNPRILKNSRNFPMYLLCFVASNPKDSAKNAAIRIAEHLLRKIG